MFGLKFDRNLLRNAIMQPSLLATMHGDSEAGDGDTDQGSTGTFRVNGCPRSEIHDTANDVCGSLS